MDFATWASDAVETLTMRPGASAQAWVDLFAPGGTYADPLTEATSDVTAIYAITEATFPDWAMTLAHVRGDHGGGVIEWIGRGHLRTGPLVTLHACSVIDLDTAGLVVRWRDYFDMGEFERDASRSDH